MIAPAAVAFALFAAASVAQPLDRTHVSRVFGGERSYRILLPSGYAVSGKRYPVVYYWHSHSDRYTVENQDGGRETIPRMLRFVAGHDLIIVCPDGYVARDYTGFYGGSPYDVGREGGDYDFGAYFHELVAHIDATYRTRTGRGHRATAGLSMGGFMSLYLSARYPDLVGSASAFNPGPEFYVGEKGARVLWRPKDHVANHGHTMVRLVRASGDYISQYHEETREAYARSSVPFEFRQDEYHRHWATSIEETLEFHMRAFEAVDLRRTPDRWSHANAHRTFEVWGWRVEVERAGAGLTYLEGVARGGLRVRTRKWAPDGPPCQGRVRLTTAALYRPGGRYEALVQELAGGAAARRTLVADAAGRLTLEVGGEGAQVGIVEPGAGPAPPVLLPVTARDVLRLGADRDLPLPIRIFNPGGKEMRDVRLKLSSLYPTVAIVSGSAVVARLAPGGTANVSPALGVRVAAAEPRFEHARLRLAMSAGGGPAVQESIDVRIAPSDLPAPVALEVLDGRTAKFRVFRQKGNQGGGAAIEREATEGSGNGNGILEPGEEATLWVRLKQGIDPFDKDTWHRVRVYCDSPYIVETERFEEAKQREWTGARELTSRIRLAPGTPSGAAIPVWLENESWSFSFQPDMRYGSELLYQAFQLHRFHLHAFTLRVP